MAVTASVIKCLSEMSEREAVFMFTDEQDKLQLFVRAVIMLTYYVQVIRLWGSFAYN